MTNKKKNPAGRRGRESILEDATHSKEVNTPASNPLLHKLSKDASRQLDRLRPWNAWLTPVENAPEYFPGAVKTASCPFCGRVHFYIGPTCPDDPGIRALPCHPADRLPEWQVPPQPESTVLCRRVNHVIR